MTTAIIRLATPDDSPAIQAIYAPYVLNHIYSFDLTPPTIDEMRERIAKTLARFPYLVCTRDDGVIVGYAYAGAFNERAAYAWSAASSVYVRDGMQRQKIGRGLYTALFDLLKSQGFVNVYAGITLPNEASVGLHQSMGFAPVGAYRNAGYKFGGWYDVGWYHLQLIAPPPSPAPIETIDYTNPDPTKIAIFEKAAALVTLNPGNAG